MSIGHKQAYPRNSRQLSSNYSSTKTVLSRSDIGVRVIADRVLVYPGSIPLDTDLLQTEQNTMIALGYALQAAYGSNTVFVGLACQPTSPASMSITIGPGAVISPSVIETTAFGSLPSDTTDPLVKCGINIVATTFTLTAPTSSGQSQNYLVQGTFSEADDTPATLTYFNTLNPNQPFSGPANSGTPQNTRRAQRANLQIKVGVPANTGTQVTPPVDQGWNGLYIVTVNFGQTAITSAAISTYPNAPFLAAFLNSHHGGVPGQAPKINLGTEVQGILSSANLPTAVGSSLVFAGNPNGFVAGTAAIGSSPPSRCWDTVEDIWWTCVTTGSVSTAVWAASNNWKNIQSFTTSGTFTVPAGVTRVRFTVTGGGGGGSNCNSVWPASSINDASGGGGGGGGTAIGIFTVTPGQSIPITIGGGGAAQSNGSSSSAGSLCSATGGVGANFPSLAISPGAAGGLGTGGQINLWGSYGSDGQAFAAASFGNGGGSFWGPGLRAYAGTPSAPSEVGPPGAGGGGAYSALSGTGLTGVSGIIVAEW
jgi:hypothetical protein